MNVHRPIATIPSLDAARVSDEVCRMMGEILDEGVDVHRCLAAQALGRIGSPSALEPLVAALLDEDEDVRTDAAQALLQLADPRAGKQLLENLLGDPCTDVKLAAIEALARMQDRRVIPWLRRLVKGRDEEIAWDEAEFYASGWDDWTDVQIKAVTALATLNADEAVPDIAAAMRDEQAQDMTETAFKTLARLGSRGIEALAGFLDEESTRLRRRAAAALAASDAKEAEEPVVRAIADPSAEVRMAVMRALAARSPMDSRLPAFIDDPDDAVRAEAVRLFGRRHRHRLPALLDDQSIAVQVAVLAEADSLPADQALVESLRVKLSGGPEALTIAAAKALGAIAPDTALDDLTQILGDTARRVEIRIAALQGLALAGGAGAVQALIAAIDDDARSLRLEAMTALARLARTESAWPNAAGMALISALSREPDEPVEPPVEPAETSKKEAIEADAADGGEGFPTSTIGAILADVPAAPLAALRLPGEGIEMTPLDMERLALARRIKGKKRMPLAPKVHRHDDIRRFSARVLGDLHRCDVASALAAVLGDADNALRMAAADSLACIGETLHPLPSGVCDALMAAAATAEPDLKILLIRALAAGEGAHIGDALHANLDDDNSFVRAEAIRALHRRGQAGPKIEALLRDPDPAVRLCAAEAVTGAGDAVEQLVEFALSFEGYHGRHAARLLRRLDAAEASGRFMAVLRNPAKKRTWSVAIEALAELNDSRPGPLTLATVS